MQNQEETKNSNLDEALKLLLDSDEKDAEEELKKGLDVAARRPSQRPKDGVTSTIGIRG